MQGSERLSKIKDDSSVPETCPILSKPTHSSGLLSGENGFPYSNSPQHDNQCTMDNKVFQGLPLQTSVPKQIILTRSREYGYGFTLRHFIVYPPDELEVERSDEEQSLFSNRHEPLDTIFVRQVREGSPAHLAGLTTGDRILRVNETDVQNNSYQEVITIIQNSYQNLQLVVVPKENDLLQQVFSNTAHNPESNLNLSWSSWSSISSLSPCLPNPSTHQCGNSFFSHSRVNTCDSSPISMPGFPAHRKVAGSIPYAKTKHHTAPLLSSVGSTPATTSSSQPHLGRKGSSSRDNKSKLLIVDRKQAVYNIKNYLPIPLQRSSSEQNASIYGETSKDDFNKKNKVTSTNSNDATKRGGVYEPVVVKGDVIGEPKRLERDPDGRLYEVVQTRLIESNVTPQENSFLPLSKSNTVSSISRRKDSSHNLSPIFCNPPKAAKLEHDSYLSPNRRLSEYNCNKENIGKALNNSLPLAADRPTQEAIARIKKNVERKEEFLKRPNEPLWQIKDVGTNNDCPFSPQKMQRPLWPPPTTTEPPPGSITKALSFIFADQKNAQPSTKTSSQMEGPRTASVILSKSSEQLRNYFDSRSNSLPNSPIPHDDSFSSATTAQPSSLPYYSNNPLVGNNVAKPYGMQVNDEPTQPSKMGRPFVRTLSRIHENIPASDSKTPPQTPTSSLGSPSSTTPIRSLPLAWINDNERIKQLQIVSTRAKKFESPNAEREAKKTAFHRFELSRLSQRANAFNVADRRKEFERRDSNAEISSPGAKFELGTSFNYNPINKRGYESPWRSKDEMPRGGIMKSLSDGGNIFPVSKDFLSPSDPYYLTPPLSVDFSSLQGTGNRMIPVGGTKIHCEPPDSRDPDGNQPLNDSDVLTVDRDRSNSTVSHSLHWSPYVNDCERRKSSPIIRQHSFHTIQAHLALAEVPESDLAEVSLNGGVSSPHSGSLSEKGVGWPSEKGPSAPLPSRPQRPTFLNIKQHARPQQRLNHQGAVLSVQQRLAASNEGLSNNAQQSPSHHSTVAVTRRNKQLYAEEGDRLVRRVSYLKATSGDRIYSDSDVESEDEKHLPPVSPRTIAKRTIGSQITADLPSPASFQSSVTSSGILHVKLAKVQGKRASDRSWKSVWGVLRGKALLFYKDKQQATQTPLAPEEQVTLRGAEVGVATDYTKRRHVFRLSTPAGSQFLLQAESDPAMTAWLTSLTAATSQDVDDQSGKPVSAPLADAETLSPCLDGGSPATTPTSSTLNDACQGSSDTNVSPQTTLKNVKKLTSPQRSKAPPMDQTLKNKKAPGDSNSSPKSKTWKGKLGRHLRKMQGVGTGVSTSAPSETLPEGASIGVCLEDCPPSPDNEFVPLLVSLCISVVETKGLSIQGIYRVPGNRAAVTYLTEVVNKGPNAVDLSDARWSDVNVISSLLKHFFRKLPDPLITTELYPHFIDASRIEDPQQRLVELKHLVQDLPDHHYETLRFLCLHLHHVISQSVDNKMDVRNLAIVFGPTLVRAADDNMAKMVTDMSHQCQIVEMLLSHVAWFFNDDESDEPPPTLGVSALSSHSVPSVDTSVCAVDAIESSSQSLLLNNVQKLEANNKDTKKLLVSSIISAANRRVQKVRKKIEEETPSAAIDTSPSHPSFESQFSPEFTEESRPSRVSNSSYAPSSNRDGRLFSDLSDLSDSKFSSLTSVNTYSVPDRTLIDPSPVIYGGPLSTTVKSAHKSLSSSGGLHSSLSRSEPSYLNPDGTIKSYSGLRESVEDRKRMFEMETRANLMQKHTLRHCRQVEKEKIEEELLRAKKDMETEDIFDRLADNPSEVMHMMSNCWAPNREAVSLPSLRNQPCGLSLANASLSTNVKDDKFHTEDQSRNQPRPHNEGSDLMSAITATFEEKMRLLQESHSIAAKDSMQPPTSCSVNQRPKAPKRNPEGNKCKLYRDPSLHRRRTNLHSAPIKHSASSDAITDFTCFEDDSEQKENMEKSEKRSLDCIKVDPPQEKRTKELKRCEVETSPQIIESLNNCTELKSRRHNVRELKEKFEQNIPVLTPQEKNRKRKSRIKRRHTVGGMKDIARVAWLKVIEAAHYDDAQRKTSQEQQQLPSWEQLQMFVEALAETRKIDAHRVHSWVAKEKLDVDAIVSLVGPKESLKRRQSVREPKALHPVLESNV